MARNQALRSRRDLQIKDEFMKLSEPRKFRTEYIVLQLSQKYFLAERTIQAIIWGEYERAEERRQLSLFN
jgi:hypothetical protein